MLMEIYIYGCIGFIVLIGIFININQLQTDVRRINKKLIEITKQTGIADTSEEEVKRLISEGKKIQAIKKYRETTGLGLKEAKEYVDTLSE